jgi:hypothetical protein
MSIQANTALLAVVLLLWPGLIQASGQLSKPSHDESLKAQLIEIPTGSIVQVKLQNKQRMRGKIGAVTDAGFELQTLREGRIATETLAFPQVKSVRLQGNGMSTAAKVTLGALAGLGVFFVILIAIAAAHGY